MLYGIGGGERRGTRDELRIGSREVVEEREQLVRIPHAVVRQLVDEVLELGLFVASAVPVLLVALVVVRRDRVPKRAGLRMRLRRGRDLGALAVSRGRVERGLVRGTA